MLNIGRVVRDVVHNKQSALSHGLKKPLSIKEPPLFTSRITGTEVMHGA